MNERVELISNFAPWSGIYMFHCHNLVHEDHDMMAAFNVSQVDLTSYGYPETTSFIDPMTPAFRPKDMSTLKFQSGTQEYLADIRESVLKKFVDLNAYPDSKGVGNALDSYLFDDADCDEYELNGGWWWRRRWWVVYYYDSTDFHYIGHQCDEHQVEWNGEDHTMKKVMSCEGWSLLLFAVFI
jgi:hypothetical protein